MKTRIIKLLCLFIISTALIQCNLSGLSDLLKPLENEKNSNSTNKEGKSSYKYSIYNPNAHVVNSWNFAYEVPITMEYLFNADYVWLATVNNVRYLYQFGIFYGEPAVYSASVSSTLKYDNWQIYEDRRLLPTLVYEDGTNWYMSSSPVFYEYKNEYAMNIDFNFDNKNNLLFTNIKPALNPIALKDKYLEVAINKGSLVSSSLNVQQIESELLNTEWYTMDFDYSKRLTDNSAPSYQFLENNKLKVSTGADDPSTSTNSLSKGWSVWQAHTGNFYSYLSYVYIYDIKMMKVYLDIATQPSGQPFPSLNSNLDVAMYWYNPATFVNSSSTAPDKTFTRYTLDKD